jgi:DnaJ like chaperone protein
MGSLTGLFIGNLLDKALSKHFIKHYPAYHAQKHKETQKIFFETTFLVMGHIAKADGYISVHEIEAAKNLMNEMQLKYVEKELAKNLFTQGKQAEFNLLQTLHKLQSVCSYNRELLNLFIDIQYRAAKADGLNYQKAKVLNTILSYLGFAPLEQQYRFYDDFMRQDHKQNQSKQEHQPPSNHQLSQAYSVLGTSERVGRQELKRIYRRLLSKNHPDKLTAQGLPPGMIKLANEKTYAIMKAYELICQEKGWGK